MKRHQDLRAVLRVVLMLVCVERSTQVPASPMDRFWEEIANVKTMMTSISSELERFNTLYLGKLETRMVSMATLLANLDSNVKNLQERAHVWDTFQLHVAAWNEQINTLDKKVDILSRGQEKLVQMDSKVSTLVNLDYKVERLVRKMDESDNKLAVISKALDNQRDDPLFGEFATRGILSTLKVIERKVDHIEGSLSHSQAKSSKNCGKRNESGFNDNIEGGEESVVGNGKLVIKCNTPVIVEELLRDVASKVDVIFDKIGQEDSVELRTEEQLSDEQVSMEQPKSESAETELFDRLLKRMSGPNKKTARVLESMEKTLHFVENTTTALWKDQTSMLDQILACCTKSEQKIHSFSNTADTSLKRFEYLLTTRETAGGAEGIARQLHEQTSYLEAVFKKHLDRETCPSGRETVAPPVTGGGDEDVDEDSTATQSSEDDAMMTSPKTSCDRLSPGAASGVYRLGHVEPGTPRDERMVRYCDMATDGGGWTVIQRRGDFPGRRQNFSLSWEQYKRGFGNRHEEFWIGNDVMHTITNDQDVTLRIDLEDFDGNTAWAHYTLFNVGPESAGYKLRVGGYSGNATDSFTAHDEHAFSTVDRKNDAAPDCCPCAPAYGGGWWFYSCFEANLNGEFYSPTQDRDFFRGLIWEHWLGNVSLRSTRMMIRPRGFVSHNTTSTTSTASTTSTNNNNNDDDDDSDKDQDFEVVTSSTNPEDVQPIGIPEDP